MGSIFLRIYSSMLLASVFIAVATYLSLAGINEARLSRYLNQVAKGTFTLIAEGAGRHQGAKREQWLNIITRLTKLPLDIKSADTLNLSAHQQSELDNRRILIKPLRGGKLAEVYVRIANKPLANETPTNETQQYLAAQLSDINEPLARVTALLILNELGRHQKTQRDQILSKLQQQFGFPIARLASAAADLNRLQQDRLANGDAVVILRDAVTTEPVIQVYAPYGNSGDLLMLGPIPLFNWYPINLLAATGVMILVMMALASYVLVRPLENRLKHMATEVDRLEAGKRPNIPVEGSDAIARLANQINKAAKRINGLLESQRDLTLAVSHELKTPVARLKFRLTLLEDTLLETLADANSELATDALQGMNRDIQQLEALLQEMLNYASLERQEPDLQSQSFDLCQVITDLCQDSQARYPQLHIDFSSELQQVVGDPIYIRRAIENLLSNACRYARQQITVHTLSDSQNYLIQVADDGPGVPEQHYENVFAPFYRIDSSRNRQSGGSGLGLAIVQKIAHRHQGKISIDKSQYGGANFELSWPHDKP